MKEIVFYKSPLGQLKLCAENDVLTGLYFVSTQKNGTSENPGEILTQANPPVLTETIRQLDDYFAGRQLIFSIPLNQEGTPFQQKVWNELLNIKAGKPISYLQLSKRLGDVKAIRAVGTANGKNNIAIIVPCHRVIGSNGSLVGYGGDLWRKQWLLEHEAKFCNGVQSLFE
jgi:methylated-DNA-[protein]-cysteine S-methyltransferase